MNIRDKLIQNGYDEIKYLDNYTYDTAVIGVTTDNRVVYDYELMIQFLIDNENLSRDEAIDWIDYNTIRALPYMGEDGPIVIYPLID